MTGQHPPSNPRRSSPRRRRYSPAVEPLESRVVLSTSTWTGMGDGVNWSNSNNWDHAPQAGADLVFPVLASKKYQVVDDLASFTADSMTFLAGYGVGDPFGNNPKASPSHLTLDGPITDRSAAAVGLGVSHLTLGAASTVDIEGGGFYFLRADSTLDGGGAITKTGPGTLGFLPTQTAAYSGSIEVAAGSVVALSSSTIAVPVTVDANAILEVSANLTLSLTNLAGAGTAQVDAGASLLFDSNQQLDLATPVTGLGTLVQDGTQDLILDAPDSVSSVDVRSGTVQLGTSSDPSGLAIASDFEVESSGSLDVENPNATIGSLDGPGNLILDSDLTIGDSKSTSITGPVSGSGNLQEQGTGTITFEPAQVSSWGGVVALGQGFSSRFSVNAAGVVTATPQNPDQSPGPITISGGGITVGASTALPPVVTVKPGTKIKVAGNETQLSLTELDGGDIELDGGSLELFTQVAYDFSASISGNGSFIKDGPGVLSFDESGDFSGPIQVNQGTLVLSTFGNSGALDVAAGAILKLDGSFSAASYLDQSSDRQPALTGGGQIDLEGSTLTLDASEDDVSLDGGPSIVGQGNIVQAGGNVTADTPLGYTGGYEVEAGTLALNTNSGNNTPFATALDVTIESGATLSDESPITVGSIAGAGTIAMDANITTGDATSTAFTGALQENGGAGLIVQGSGVFSLDPASIVSQDNPVTILGGTLLPGGPGGVGAYPIALDSGTLEGAGVSIAHPTIQAGIIAPGTTSTPGTLTLSGATLTPTTTVAIRLDGTSSGSSDQLDSGGVVDLGGSKLSPSLGYAAKAGDAITILAASGATSYFHGQFAGLPEGATAYTGGEPFSIHYATANVSGTTRTVAVTLTRIASATSTAVSVPTVATAGRPLALGAHVAEVAPASGHPSGMVQFLDGTKVLGSAPIDANGNAVLVLGSLVPGYHSIQAAYVATANDTASTSTASLIFVAPATPADFDGDGKTDVAVFRPSTATFFALDSSNGGFVAKQFGVVGDVPVPADYDGDGKTDDAVFRPSTQTFYILDSSTGNVVTKQFGVPGDVPVPADYDGDGKADIAVFRPSTDTYYVLDSSNNALVVKQFGTIGDIPVSADYDGDGKADFAVFRPSTDTFFLLDSSNNAFVAKQFGAVGDQPVPADFDGDGRADFAVFRPSTATFFVLDSSNDAFVARQFGAIGDVPIPGDFDGDGRADFAVFRPSTATDYVLDSSNGAFVARQFGAVGDVALLSEGRRAVTGDFTGEGHSDVTVFRPSTATFYTLDPATGAATTVQFGAPGDVPIRGDFDGDGRADVAVFRPSTQVFYILDSSTGQVSAIQFGAPGDVPVPADYDGDGRTDIAVFRPSTQVFYVLDSSTGLVTARQFGASGDQPVPADYDGDGRADFAVYRPSTSTFFVLDSSNGAFVAQQFGVAGDDPVPADYDGDGRADFAVFRPGTTTFYVLDSSTGSVLTAHLGLSGDVPIPDAYLGEGTTDLAVFRPSTATFYILDPSTGLVTPRQWGIAGDLPD